MTHPFILKRRQRRRRRRIAFTIIVLIPVIYIVWMAVLAARPKPNSSGYPETLEELDAWYEQVPDEENAARFYEKARGLYVYDRNADQIIRQMKNEPPLLTGPLSEDVKTVLAAYTKRNQPAIDVLYEAGALTRCRFAVDFRQRHSLDLSHYRPLCDGTDLLQVQAIVSTEDGDAGTAVKAILAALAAPQSLHHEPFLISQHQRTELVTSSLGALERVLNRVSLPDDALSALLAALSDVEYPDAMTRSLIGERCLGLACFDDPDWTGGGLLVGGVANEFIKQISPVDSRTVISKAYAWSGIRDFDRTVFLKIMASAIDLSRSPFPQALDDIPEVGELRSWRTPVSRMMTGNLWCFRVQAAYLANLRLARTALAIERYRLANDTLPEAFFDLVPEFLPEVLNDPFDGAPLRYLPTPDSYTLYSVGDNRKDDGGKRTPNNSHQYDITFTVERPRVTPIYG